MVPYLRETSEGVELLVLVQPRASRTRIVGMHDGRLKIQVASPPVDGAANEALLELVAATLAVGRSALRLAQGEAGRRKRLLIRGASAADAERALKASP